MFRLLGTSAGSLRLRSRADRCRGRSWSSPGSKSSPTRTVRFPIGEGRGETRVRDSNIVFTSLSPTFAGPDARRCANYSRTLKALLLAANRMVVLPHLGTMAIVCRRSACNGRTRVTKRASSFAHAHGPAACTCNRATVR